MNEKLEVELVVNDKVEVKTCGTATHFKWRDAERFMR